MDFVPSAFDYSLAFSRNLGWFKPEDQQLLRTKRIAIPGLGGVGGHHLHNFLRLGFQKFNLADPDSFEIQNFNRQMGASIETVGLLKTDVLERMAKTINPDVEIRSFRDGVNIHNQDEFLKEVDIVVDALDLYAMDIRISLYEAAHRKGIPVVTAGPFGMGTAIMAFSPYRMSFNQYFDFNRENLTVEAKIIRFLAGVTPNLMHQKYLRHRIAVDLFERRLPSLNIGCFAAGAAMGAMVTKILLNPNDPNIRWAPHGFHVDFNLQKSIRFWRPWGNRNPLQKLKIKIYHKFFRRDEYQK
ncbi:MAG: ThiF family adenylyltransferase [Bdellovibrionaceae bacterium]|nr:ThiF family adenylyltransferase [Pseudobdellovibrionaceae bacterium]